MESLIAEMVGIDNTIEQHRHVLKLSAILLALKQGRITTNDYEVDGKGSYRLITPAEAEIMAEAERMSAEAKLAEQAEQTPHVNGTDILQLGDRIAEIN